MEPYQARWYKRESKDDTKCFIQLASRRSNRKKHRFRVVLVIDDVDRIHVLKRQAEDLW